MSKAMLKAYNPSKPVKGLVLYFDSGSQYTIKQYRRLLWSYGVRTSVGDVAACWDNSFVKRFFGSSKQY